MNGLDPKEERDRARDSLRQQARVTPSFEDVAHRCIAAKRHEWSNAKHAKQWEATLKTYAYPVIGALPVDKVTIEHLLQILEPIWTTKTETATRLRQRIETVLDWAKARKYLTGENPAALKGGLGELLPKPSKVAKVVHYPALPYHQAHDFLLKLRKMDGIAPRALEFLLLTACRSGEVLGARWSEIDLVEGLWTIPADRMKAGREHRVPLSSRAKVILKNLPREEGCDIVFPRPGTKKQLSSGALLAVMKRMPAFANYVPHGLRSTFRDWAAETTRFPNEVLELALAHTIKNKAEAAYRRGDQLQKRVALMEQWASFVGGVQGSATVTPIGRANVR